MEQLDMFAPTSDSNKQIVRAIQSANAVLAANTKQLANAEQKTIKTQQIANVDEQEKQNTETIEQQNPLNNNAGKYVYIDVKNIDVPDWCYKNTDPEIILKLKGLLLKYGQVRNIQVRHTDNGRYEVVNGKSLFTAMKALGYKRAFCYVHDNIDTIQGLRIAIETDETHQQVDHIKLSEAMQMLSDKYTVAQLATTMPYMLEQITELIKLYQFDWEQFSGIENPDQISMF